MMAKPSAAADATVTAFCRWLFSGCRAAFAGSAALRRELVGYVGCLMIFWLIGAASISGFVITAFFVAVAAIHLARNIIRTGLDRLASKRALAARYLGGLVSLTFFSLLGGRACYIAATLVDTALQHGELTGIALHLSNRLQ
jgi:hypothetical protein